MTKLNGAVMMRC